MHELVAQWSVPLPGCADRDDEPPVMCRGGGVLLVVHGPTISVLRDGAVIACRRLPDAAMDGAVTHATIVTPRSGPMVALTTAVGCVTPRTPASDRAQHRAVAGGVAPHRAARADKSSR